MVIKRLFSFSIFFVALCASAFFSHAWADDSAWRVAIEQDRPQEVMRELAQGMDPNSRDSELNPALMVAIRNQSWGAYDVLLANRNTDIELANGRQETPMMYLALLGETKRLQALQQRGGQVNRLGWTPLHYAASKGHLDTVRYLLTQKAIVNAPAPNGTSPLMMAAFSGKRDVVDALLAAGADSRMQNAEHQKASDWARSAGHEQLASYLEEVEQGRQTPSSSVNSSVNKPAPAQSQNKRSAVKPDASQGSARYFDLDRFDEPSTP